jgi:hypothetical protein
MLANALQENSSRGGVVPGNGTTPTAESLVYMHPLKSICAALVVAPGVTLSG